MKSLILKENNKLRSEKGETLIEAIVSILILAILLTTIVAMIGTSRRITANTMIEARGTQDGVMNPVTLASPDLYVSEVLTLRSDLIVTDVYPVNELSHPVNVFDSDLVDDDLENAAWNIVAFHPVSGGGP